MGDILGQYYSKNEERYKIMNDIYIAFSYSNHCLKGYVYIERDLFL